MNFAIYYKSSKVNSGYIRSNTCIQQPDFGQIAAINKTAGGITVNIKKLGKKRRKKKFGKTRGKTSAQGWKEYRKDTHRLLSYSYPTLHILKNGRRSWCPSRSNTSQTNPSKSYLSCHFTQRKVYRRCKINFRKKTDTY